MKINGREVRKPPRGIKEDEPAVHLGRIFSRDVFSVIEADSIQWPVAEDTIDDLCDMLRDIAKPRDGLNYYNVRFNFDHNNHCIEVFLNDKKEVSLGKSGISALRDMCNEALGEESDYKAALEKIKIIIDDMPQLERWLGAAEAAKGFKLICDLLNETL